MARIKCPKCGAEVEIADDVIILKKWGKCAECNAEIGWDEVVPNNPIIEKITVD